MQLYSVTKMKKEMHICAAVLRGLHNPPHVEKRHKKESNIALCEIYVIPDKQCSYLFFQYKKLI